MVPQAWHDHPSEAKLVNAVYYPSWRIYRGCPPSMLDTSIITHVFYAFARVRDDGSVYPELMDDWADNKIRVDGTRGCLRATAQLKLTNPHLKVLLSVGGASGSKEFPDVAASLDGRRKFAASCKILVDSFGLDGIDVDWEHPANTLQGKHFLLLITALRARLPRERYMLTTALPAGAYCLRNLDLLAICQLLNFINIMAYDFAGPWTSSAGHHAQLFSPSITPAGVASRSCQTGIEYLLSRGVPARRMILGVPVYARGFNQARGPGDAFVPCQNECDATVEYKSLILKGLREQVDEDLGAAFCVDGDSGFLSFDNAQTVLLKAKFVKERNLGGLFFWTGTADAGGGQSLVRSGYTALLGVPPNDKACTESKEK